MTFAKAYVMCSCEIASAKDRKRITKEPGIAGKCWYWSLSSDAVGKYMGGDGESL